MIGVIGWCGNELTTVVIAVTHIDKSLYAYYHGLPNIVQLLMYFKNIMNL